MVEQHPKMAAVKNRPNTDHPVRVFWIFLRLGMTSFGGPIAHLGYFHDEFVKRRNWLSDHAYADLVALCQFLPGPASSQVGMALGLRRAGHAGAVAAWAGFTLPSAVALTLFALVLKHYGALISGGFLHGLKMAAAAVVAQAVWGMARTICTDGVRLSLMAAVTCLLLWLPSTLSQMTAIAIVGLIGYAWFKPPATADGETAPPIAASRKSGPVSLVLFTLILAGLPLLDHAFHSQTLALVDAFYRSGALVFGGGHVVLPLLQAQVVPRDWVSSETFLAGYGMAQAVPGPLFTFAAFLGASMKSSPSGWLGSLICLIAIFLPSFLLVLGISPFWNELHRHARIRAALAGVNVAVVGLLLAAFYHPVMTSAITRPADFGVVLVAVIALTIWKFPPWLVVAGCSGLGWLVG